MKSSYIERATNFLHRIYPRIYRDMNSPAKISRIIMEYNRANRRAILVYHGATRCVLITSDYVIKWNYGTSYKDYGGCLEEVETYAQAKKDGFSHLLAEATGITYRNTFFEIMPRFNVEPEEEDKPYFYDMINVEEYWWMYDHVSDIHSQNYTIVDDRPILIDYACRPKTLST